MLHKPIAYIYNGWNILRDIELWQFPRFYYEITQFRSVNYGQKSPGCISIASKQYYLSVQW